MHTPFRVQNLAGFRVLDPVSSPGTAPRDRRVYRPDPNRMRMYRFVLALLLVGTAPVAVHASGPAVGVALVAAALQQLPQGQPGDIDGVVLDAVSGQPVANVQVRLRELGRSELSHADGSFHFTAIGARSYTVAAQRIGYAPLERVVRVEPGMTMSVELRMIPSALEVAGIVVTGTGRERGVAQTYQPTAVLGDAELRRRLDTSLAGTLHHLPGISQQYNGPAASQPVIRGMGGDRVLVLEDGQRTGDLATTGADHAITIDPVSAQRIEVVRGPAGLLYGSNALGGVINVIREDVPRSLPEALAGSVSLQAESVNDGVAGALSFLVPHGRFGLRGELTGRTAGDTRTPLGALPSTEIRSVGGGLGASMVRSWGYLGAAYRDFDLAYGVPGEFQGELIPGAHPGGVRIESRRRSGRFEIGRLLGLGPVSSVSFDANLVQYDHREIEGFAAGRPLIGARFDNLFGSGNLLIRHEHEVDPVFTEGAIGFSGTARRLRTGGGFTGSRDATALSTAVFAYEELATGAFRFQLGGRYDWTHVRPDDRTPILTGTREIPVRDRTFAAMTGSGAIVYELLREVFLGVSVARAYRTPSVEELYSDGPHLADYSYDIGSPDLEPEYGVGGDLFLRINRTRFHAEGAVYRNWLRRYIYYAPTGELDPRLRRFPVFEARGADALFEGAEMGLQWEAVRNLVLDGSVSVVRATRSEDGDPLPSIPPLNGTTGVRYEFGRFFLTGSWEGARAQNRVPAAIPAPTEGPPIQIERPTPGYTVWGSGGGVRWLHRGTLHTLTLQVENLTDSVRRDHLSRIKEVAPQPGRNLQLLYRAQF